MTAWSLGASRRGVTSWLMQRVSALYMAVFVLFLTMRFLLWPVSDFAVWRTWWSGTIIRIALALFVTSLLLHAWFGLRSIYMDYVRSWILRFAVSAVTALSLSLVGLWCARLVLTVL